MSNSQATGKKTTAARRIARSGLYLIPGYPLVKAAASMKDTVATGLQTITDQNRELAAQRRNPRSRTFNEALAMRSAEALPLGTIERRCARKKQFFMAVAFVSASFLFGSTMGGNYFGTLIGLLFTFFCLMFAVKFEHQLWQIETGRTTPDEPLGGYRQFFACRGALRRLFDPRLFR